ncbi:MAG: sugar phosphate isomerase/epimerase family protein [Planctomycetota bacterium]
MKKAICHYSYHRTLADQKWELADFVRHSEKLDVDGIDFHQRFLPPPEQAPAAIRAALKGSALALAGLSLSTNFNKDDAGFKDEIALATRWINAAGAAGAPVSRIFGGHIPDRKDREGLQRGIDRVLQALETLVPVAARAGVVLALENHGGVPGTGEEQADMIKRINAPHLRATVDVGNYMSCGQSAVDGTRIAAPLCGYVHFKDFKKLADGRLGACVIGKGDVDHAACLKILHAAGFNGYVALEYEGETEELAGVPESMAFVHKVMQPYEPLAKPPRVSDQATVCGGGNKNNHYI